MKEQITKVGVSETSNYGSMDKKSKMIALLFTLNAIIRERVWKFVPADQTYLKINGISILDQLQSQKDGKLQSMMMLIIREENSLLQKTSHV